MAGLTVADGIGASLVTVVGGLLFGSLFLAATIGGIRLRRLTTLGIVLTPTEVVLRTWTAPVPIPWEAVTGVRDHWNRVGRVGPTMPKDLIRNWLTFEIADARGDLMTFSRAAPAPAWTSPPSRSTR